MAMSSLFPSRAVGPRAAANLSLSHAASAEVSGKSLPPTPDSSSTFSTRTAGSSGGTSPDEGTMSASSDGLPPSRGLRPARGSAAGSSNSLSSAASSSVWPARGKMPKASSGNGLAEIGRARASMDDSIIGGGGGGGLGGMKKTRSEHSLRSLATTTASMQTTSRARRMVLKEWLLVNGFTTVTAQHTGHFGRTYYPLHKAVKQNNAQIVEMLLQSGADASCRNYAGLTPGEWARRHNWRGSYKHILELVDNTLFQHAEEQGEESLGSGDTKAMGRKSWTSRLGNSRKSVEV